MYEYRFALSVRKVRAGTVIFSVVNKGQLAHDFAIERLQKTSVLIQPGDRVRFRPIDPSQFEELDRRAAAGEPVAERS